MAGGADGSAATEGDSWLSDRDLRDHRLPTGGGGGAAEAGLSPSDFLPRHAPPSLREAGGLAGLRQWCVPAAQTPLGSHVFAPATKAAADVANGCCARYDIEIGAIEVQASKLQQQLEMASHAIALLTAARDRETEE